MTVKTPPRLTDLEVTAMRPAKNRLDPWKPYAFLVEPERSAEGTVDDVMTIFLTNRECPFHCTMCDLWKNTLDDRAPAGAIAAQIDYARERLPPARHVKLYNAGNFFDRQAIDPDEHAAIAERVREMRTVIVENHPRLTDESCVEFRDRLEGEFEIAMGLETIHPDLLSRMNKRMTVEDFDQAALFLTQNGIHVRTFLQVNPPGMDCDEGIEWALRSLVHAIEVGSRCVSLIPTRGGNGLMEQWGSTGVFQPPTIRSIETTLERGLELSRRLNPGVRVFMDLWDVTQFSDCVACGPTRADRIDRMNREQCIPPAIDCPACRGG